MINAFDDNSSMKRPKQRREIIPNKEPSLRGNPKKEILSSKPISLKFLYIVLLLFISVWHSLV